jgi:hypothetical protein
MEYPRSRKWPNNDVATRRQQTVSAHLKRASPGEVHPGVPDVLAHEAEDEIAPGLSESQRARLRQLRDRWVDLHNARMGTRVTHHMAQMRINRHAGVNSLRRIPGHKFDVLERWLLSLISHLDPGEESSGRR